MVEKRLAPNSKKRGSDKRASKGSKLGAQNSTKLGRRQNAATSNSTTKEAVKNPFLGRRRDVGMTFFMILSIVLALSIYWNTTGKFGDGIVSGLGIAMGILRYAIPIIFLLVGILLAFPKGYIVSKLNNLTIKSETSESSKVNNVYPSLIAVGSALSVISVLGMLHLTSGQPALQPYNSQALQEAGGVVGSAVGIPLVALMDAAASGVVFIGIGIVGLSLATGVTFGFWFSLFGATITKLRARPITQISSAKKKSVPKNGFGGLDPLATNGFSQNGAPKQKGVKKETKKELGPETEPKVDRRLFAGAKKIKSKSPKPVEVKAEFKKSESITTATVPTRKSSAWKLPSVEVLHRIPEQQNKLAQPTEEQSIALTAALESHGVEVTLTGWVVGPTVTRYELELDEGVKVSSITKLHKDIAYAMAANDVRILAPIPGRKAIGIEVPNSQRELVLLGDLLVSKEAKQAKHPLEVALGRDINGTTIMMNLAQTPHILIAGATGAGKSSCLNTAVTSLLMRCTPEEVRLILVDPKMVEMRQFENAPHLLTPPVVDPKKATNALGWAVREMDRRYEVLFRAGFREMDTYNDALAKGNLKPPNEGEETYEHMPYIVVVVDELSDLMMVAARDVEDYICRLAQKARAVGIHLVIATQRPSTDVITGVIKANIPARLAFSVSSLTDSRVILDQAGAERLVGQGDMLLRMPTSGTTTRIQGAWITEEEVKEIVKFWNSQKPAPDYIENLTEDITPKNKAMGANGGDAGDDELYEEAKEMIIRTGIGSASMLQRKLRVGFARAGRLIDLLEENGVVGPSEGPKPREVLIEAVVQEPATS